MRVELLGSTENPELIIATAAKLCYSSANIDDLMEKQTPEKIETFISRLEEMGHESPFEHASFTFAIEDVSRVTEQQLTRHRIASYSIQSGRYVNRENASFYFPSDIQENEEAKDIYIDIIEQSKDAYKKISEVLLKHKIRSFLVIEKQLYSNDCTDEHLLEVMKTSYKKQLSSFKKLSIESARMAFLNSLNTKIIVTMNVRTLWNFFAHRCCFRAQDEIREMAMKMLAILKKKHPLIFKHAGASCKKGICPEGKAMQCKQLKGKIPTYEDIRELINKYYKNGKVC